jgi:hypothetical protein
MQHRKCPGDHALLLAFEVRSSEVAATSVQNRLLERNNEAPLQSRSIREEYFVSPISA